MDLRKYDPTIARWSGIDPVTHHSMSTYTAFDNNPIFWADPSGADGEHYNWDTGRYEDDQGNEVSFETALASQGLNADGSENNDSSETNCCGFMPPNSFLGLRIGFFKSFFPKNGTANNLIDHYIYGKGEKLTLNQRQMLETYPVTDQDGNPINLSLSLFDMLSVGELSPGESKVFEDQIALYAGAAGTLGNFTLTRRGTITLNEETGQREFNGVFIFNDTYDFNSSNHRPWDAELQVTLARNFLPGQPFKVFGKMSVHQIQGRSITTKVNGFTVNPLQYNKPQSTQERRDVSKF